MNALAQALDAGGDRLEPAAVSRARATLERAGQRMRLGADLTVVALVGATGSGKSSLFNAIAGLEIAEVATRRPTTSEPTACIWGGRDADPLLDWLGVPQRRRTHRESVLDADSQASLHGLVLLDLPDHDSAFLNHRLEVDRLVELADLLIWVVDPQKYADEALHSGYLRPFRDRGDVMLVVLNQLDRLDPEEAGTCSHDLRRLLDADGLGSVPLLTASARRGDGVQALRDVLARVVRQRGSAVDRALADLAASATALRHGVGSESIDLDRLHVPDRLVVALCEAAGVSVVLDAFDADHRRRAFAQVGWPFLRWWRRLRPDPLQQVGLQGAGAGFRELVGSSRPQPTPSQKAQVDLAALQVADIAASSMPGRWASAVRAASTWYRGDSGLSGALDAAIREVDLKRSYPRWWTPSGAVQVVLAVIAAIGFGWLALIGVLDWVRAAPGVGLFIGPVPLPTAMFLGGLMLGGALAGISWLVVDVQVRRRRQDLAEQLHAAVREVAQVWVLTPVSEVVADHREVRESLDVLR
jgi:GTPase Era involved in 16S rRNA processing